MGSPNTSYYIKLNRTVLDSNVRDYSVLHTGPRFFVSPEGLDTEPNILLRRRWRRYSVQSLDRLGRRGGHEEQFSKDPILLFSAGGPCGQFWHG